MLGAALWFTWWLLVRKGEDQGCTACEQEPGAGRLQERHLRAGAAGDRGRGPEIRRLHADQAAVVAAVYALLISLFVCKGSSRPALRPVPGRGQDHLGHHVPGGSGDGLGLDDHGGQPAG